MEQQLNIFISTYASDEEKKELEEIFQELNPKVERNIITMSVEQVLLQIVIALTANMTYDFIKTKIIPKVKEVYSKIKTKEPIIKFEYKGRTIFVKNGQSYFITVKNVRYANSKNKLIYESESIDEILGLIDKEEKGD